MGRYVLPFFLHLELLGLAMPEPESLWKFSVNCISPLNHSVQGFIAVTPKFNRMLTKNAGFLGKPIPLSSVILIGFVCPRGVTWTH